MISTIKATLFLTLLFLCSSNTDLLNEFVASMPVQGKEMDKIILQ